MAKWLLTLEEKALGVDHIASREWWRIGCGARQADLPAKIYPDLSANGASSHIALFRTRLFQTNI